MAGVSGGSGPLPDLCSPAFGNGPAREPAARTGIRSEEIGGAMQQIKACDQLAAARRGRSGFAVPAAGRRPGAAGRAFPAAKKLPLFAGALILSWIAGCASPTPQQTGPARLAPPGVAGLRSARLSELVKDPVRISWSSTSRVNREVLYLYGTEGSAPNTYLAEGEFHHLDPGVVQIWYQSAGKGFRYREIKKHNLAFQQADCLPELAPETCVKEHAAFVALEALCDEVPCSGTVRVYDAHQPMRSLSLDWYLSQVWGGCFLGKQLPEDVLLLQENRFSVAEGSEMADYLAEKVRFVLDKTETIKRNNPSVQFR